MSAVAILLSFLSASPFASAIADNTTVPRIIARCDDASAWVGGTVDTALAKSADASIRWAHAESSSLRLAAPPKDWSTHTTIRFWLHSEVKTDSAFVLIIQSENPKTEGMDYWMASIRLNFVGWREILLPRRTMGWAREPLGWGQITSAYFTASGWENTPDPRAVVHIDQLELFDMPPVTGPRMTDEMLFELVDLEHAGLEDARDAYAAGDLPATKKALADYLRNRTSVSWRFDPHRIDSGISHNRRAADDTMAGKVSVISIGHTFPEGEFDWFYNPTVERSDLPVNHEWQWQLGRMGYWSNLGRTYWGTGDEQYAQAFVRQLRSWVYNCPRLDDSGNYAGSAWRTIECGIRMNGSWPDAYHRFLRSPSFTDEDILLYLKSCAEQAQHLRTHPTSGNWLTMEMSGLYTVGALFPELRDATEWRAYAIGRIYEELTKQFLPDGAQVELTPGYHQVALSNVLKIPGVARMTGRIGEIPPDFVALTEAAFDFNQYLMTPDRDLPRFNDSWHVNVPSSLRSAAELFPGRADFRWIATQGQEGTPPSSTSHALEYAGYYVMRSGWDEWANYLCFDTGPLGYGHVHQDKLNVVLWSYGREILFDGGGGNYESSPWRRYDTDTFAHNTVLVDGLPQRRQTRNRWANVSREPIEARWESTETHDFAAGTYDDVYGSAGDRIATHTRRVLFLTPDIFIVVDTLTPRDKAVHAYQARWHLMTTSTELDQETLALSTTDAERPNLVVVPLIDGKLQVEAISGQTDPELLGWWVQKNKNHKPATTVTHTRQASGVQHFITLLLPTKQGETNPVREVKSFAPTASMVHFANGGRIVVWAEPEPSGDITVQEILADGVVGRTVGAEKQR